MSTVVNILIIFFVFLILYQLFLAFISGGNNYINLIEGMDTSEPTNETDSKTDQETTEFKPYNEKDVFILEQKNAGNISYLKERVEATQDLTGEVKDLKKTVSDLQDQMTELVAAQQQYAQRMTGGTTPEITGALPEK